MAGGSVLALDAAADARGRTRSPLTLSALGKAAEAVPMVLLVTLVPRLLGPGPYGRVALAVSIVTLGSAALSVGGPMLLTRFVPAAEPTGRPALARALAVRLAWLRALTLTGVAGVAAVLGVARPDVFHPFELVLVVGALWLDVAATLFFQVALSLDRAALWAFRYAFQNALLVAAVSAFAVLGGTSEAIAGVTVASAGALVVGAVTALPTLARAQRGSPIPPGALRFGVVQGAGGVLVQFMHRAAVPAVAVLAARETQTGYAGLAVGIGLAGTYAVWQAFALQLPRLSMRADAMPRAVETAAERLAWLALLFSGAGAVAAALAVGPALPLLAGERFRGAEAAVAPALALLPLAPLSGLVTQVLALRLRADIRFWSSLAGAVVFVATAVATVPRYGAVGGTSALLAGSAAATLVAIARLPSIVSRRLVLASLALTGLTVAIASVPDPGEAAAEAGDIAAIAVAVLLALLAARRLTLLGAALARPSTAHVADAPLPTVAIVAAARNESACIDRLLDAIDRLDYPRELVTVVVVDDASTDDTAARMQRWAAGRERTAALSLPERVGKPAALNAALELAPPSELVAVCDADHGPQPESLRRVAAAFADPSVGAAGAYLRPINANATMIARYAAVETWVTQLVTSAARSRLDLNPPMLGGGAVYRRAALEDIGGFTTSLTGEDAHASILLTRHGWRTRFVRDAVVENHVVEGWREYWHQHLRWARSGYTTVKLQRGGRVSLGRKIEAWMISAGYSDRIAIVAAIALAVAGRLPPWVVGGYLAVVAAMVVAAIVRGGAGLRLPLFLFATATCLALDAAATVVATVAELAGRPATWRAPSRGPLS